MKNTDLRAKARAIFGSAVAEPMPKQPNGAKALQQRANARPIPTYKVGGPVKKADGGTARIPMTEDDVRKSLEREVGLRRAAMMSGRDMPTPPTPPSARDERTRQVLARARSMPSKDVMMKTGGPAKKMPSPGESVASGNRMSRQEGDEMRFMDAMEKKKKRTMPPAGESVASGNRVARQEGDEMRRMKAYKKGGHVQTSSDTARKLASEMGGMKKGGKPKDGLAVMIAIGGPKKPMKKMNGGAAAMNSTDMEASKVTRNMSHGGSPDGYAAGGAGKMRKGQAPIKKAQGGAAKVRKGMMTPEGNIIHAMNKMRGK